MTQTSYFEQRISGEGVLRPSGDTSIARAEHLPGARIRRSQTRFVLLLTVTLAATPGLLTAARSTVSPWVEPAEAPHRGADGARGWSLPPAPDAWPEPCETAFEAVADKDPRLLERWILAGELRPGHLCRAAQVLGRHGPSVLPSLIRLLHHPSPLVREGAVYGVGHVGNEEAVEHLRNVVMTDSSAGVRTAAKLTVQDLMEA